MPINTSVTSGKSTLVTVPEFVEPMKAKHAARAPSESGWIYEIKFDGYRALALRGGDEAQVLSRNNKDLAAQFPDVLEAVLELKGDDVILDGEIVALDPKGRSSFQLLQQYGKQKAPLFYYAFDLLRLNGKDLRSLPLLQRKARLETLLPKGDGIIRYSAALGSDAGALLEQAKKLGLEGLIGKRADSTYENGRRSGAWIKLKLLSEHEFVIGGYSEPHGTRRFFEALIVGVYEKNKLVFCAKVGSGFSENGLRDLHAQLEKTTVKQCPFSDLPQPHASKWGQSITSSEMKKCHWVKPTMVAQVKFSEWTSDGHLRHPVFLGIREDMEAQEVTRED